MLNITRPLFAGLPDAPNSTARRFLVIVVGAVVAVLLAGCATTSEQRAGGGVTRSDEAMSSSGVPEGQLLIYASFFPIADIVENVVGDMAEVRSFMPVGQDPHLWEPTPRDIQKLSKADLLVVNGANMEPWLPQIRSAVPNVPVLNLSDYVELITYKGAAALGEFQYMAATPLKAGEKYSIVFGHTHEDSMRVAFFPREEEASEKKLVERGRAALSEAGDAIAQQRNISVEPDRAYSIGMGHESGEVTFTVPSDGDWVFVADRVSEDILSYDLYKDREALNMEPVIEGGSSATDQVSFDPHSWMSPINAKRYANAVAERVVELRSDDEYDIRRKKGKFVSSITTLEAEFREKFKTISRRDFVVAHNAFGYLARDFELTQHPVQGLTSTGAPSLRSLITTIRNVRTMDIDIIYYEYGQEEKSAKTIADEIGGRTLPLASLEYLDPSEVEQTDDSGRGYVDFMRMNLENLYESLK